jgi:acylphosphatase
MKRIHVVVRGRVQGVYYRKAAEEKADALDCTGWIRNLTDGGVEFEVQGENGRVDDFLRWARRGPNAARVDEFEQDEVELKDGETDFVTSFENG